MKRRLWAPIIAVGVAALILVPTTFAVGEPGTTIYAQLTSNRFPGGQGAAEASIQFNGERDIVLRVQVLGPAGTVNAVRIYVDGTCSDPGEWVINRTPNAGPNGPFLAVNSNSGVNTFQVNQLDVDRIRDELEDNPNETFALMIARVINGANYRTCTQFRSTPFPPLTTTTTTSATGTQTTTGTNTTRFTTRTITTTINSSVITFTITEPVTTTALTTRTSFSTGTTVQTATSVVTGTTVTVPGTTVTATQTGPSTGSSAATTFTVSNFTTLSTGTSTFTVPVTTVTLTL
jgi:hypothetical protein